MSSIRWHFPDTTLCMGGRERAWMAFLINRITRGCTDTRRSMPGPDWPSIYDEFNLQLATAWAVGSRPVKLCVLIHGWCETNRVIESEAFNVIADALEEGLELGIFRKETQGYEGIERIIDRLRLGGPWCVWSYSVTDGFPRCDYETEEWMTKEATVAALREEENTILADVFEDLSIGESVLSMDRETLKEKTGRRT